MDSGLVCCLCNHEAKTELKLDFHIDQMHSDIFTASPSDEVKTESFETPDPDLKPQVASPTTVHAAGASNGMLDHPDNSLIQAASNTTQNLAREIIKKEANLPPVKVAKTAHRKRLSLQGESAGVQPKKRGKKQERLSAPITIAYTSGTTPAPETTKKCETGNADPMENIAKKENEGINSGNCEMPEPTGQIIDPIDRDLIGGKAIDSEEFKVAKEIKVEQESSLVDVKNESDGSKVASVKKRRRSRAEMEEFRSQLEIKKKNKLEKKNRRKSTSGLSFDQPVGPAKPEVSKDIMSDGKAGNETLREMGSRSGDRKKKDSKLKNKKKSKKIEEDFDQVGDESGSSTSSPASPPAHMVKVVNQKKVQFDVDINHNNNAISDRAKIEELESIILGYETRITEVETSKSLVEQLLDESNRVIEDLKMTNSVFQNQILESEQKLRALERENSEAKARNKDLTEENCELQKQVSEYQSKVEYLVGKNSKLAEQIPTYSKLKSEFDEMSSTIELLQSDSGKWKELEEELEKANLERMNLHNEVTKLRENKSEFEAEFQKKKIDFTVYQKKSLGERSKLNKDLDEARQEVDKLSKDLVNCKLENNRLVKHIENEDAKLKKANAAHIRATNELQMSRQQLDRLKGENESKERDIEHQKNVIKNTTNDLCAIRTVKHSLETILQSKSAELNGLKVDVELTDLQIKQLEKEVNLLKSPSEFFFAIKNILETIFQQDSSFCETNDKWDKLNMMSDDEIHKVVISMLEDYVESTKRFKTELDRMNLVINKMA